MVRLWCLCVHYGIYRSEFLFASTKPEIQQIFTFAALAIAFLLRPIGGIVFGIIGDKYGRKVVLTTTIILMALSTLTIGVLQTTI